VFRSAAATLTAAATLLAATGMVVTPSARAQPGPAQTSMPEPALTPSIATSRGVAWPLMFDVHALIGVEPHDRGSPIAFGAGTELLWRARIGGFVSLLASEGTPIIAPSVNGTQKPGFADRISVPFGVASRPFAPFTIDNEAWWARLVAGIGIQLGLTVEHLRTSDDNATVAGLHAALSVDVPLYGGPKQGGVALRLHARLMFTPEVNLDNRTVFEPIASGQLFAGLCYYP
jgi:hypothetical protein